MFRLFYILGNYISKYIRTERSNAKRHSCRKLRLCFFVMPRACFHCGVFRWSEKRNFENKKTTCKVSQHCFSLQKNLLWYISVSSFVGYLKGKSTLMIFERHANLKYKFGNRHFWCRGYYVDTVGKNAKKIQEYIQNQLKEDYEYDQMTLRLANHFDESLDFSAGKKPL